MTRLLEMILCAAVALVLSSCKEREFVPLDCTVYDSMIFERGVSFTMMVEDVMAQYGSHAGNYGELKGLLEEGKAAAKNYTLYGIRYRTTDHEGKPTLASGLIYYPETTHIEGIIEIVPVTKNRLSVGTVNRSIPEAIAGCTGYIMIAPDLLGCGAASDYPICYLQHDLVAKNAADMRKAAYEFLYNKRYTRLGNKDYLFGYSLGGSGVLALARFYAKHPEYRVKIKELWLGAGAYDPCETLDLIVAKRSDPSLMLPNILWSLNQYDSLGLDFNSILTGKMKEHYEELITGNVSTDSLRKDYGPAMDDYLNMDFFAEDSEDWQRCREVLRRKAVPIDFKPDYPIVIYHSEDDETIPVALSDTLNRHLLDVGAEVYYQRLKGSHHLIGFKIEGDLARHLHDFK